MPSPIDPSAPDLQALNLQAHNAVMANANRPLPSASVGPLGMTWLSWVKLALALSLVIYLLAHAGELKRQLVGVSSSTQNLEAQAVLKSARAAVEQHHRETGFWPDRVPLAALDALVSMKRTGSDYQLQFDLNGKVWTADRNGTVTGENK
jgi:hypothetical protein